ncbi:5-bromo-4-chloroindolyl phosphate hydrolysis family protein [Sporosarcina ureilytica]|uniref:5-bromo-4-chloroindolyl phosphate hydrolysis protein n=1 Tax=Sporosarcina ureilytica TaxID=298596 RepID=A0A1D8JG83_9BACL|nr:5-bromo-4-chloroindolyl phosphate hydrolysis family protein [Sporosarcina ureilytica]AOV07703.1 5-bromo-4-chloroindolyl phosphate hydrolysis protein [Sporosarcina ureilytica]
MTEIKHFFMRHFIAVPISFGSWIYLLFGTSLNFFAATGLLIVIYFASSFTIKQIQIQSTTKKLGMKRSEYNYIKGQLHEARRKLKRLNSYYGKVRSVQAFRQLHEMNLLSRKIINIVKTNPQKFYQVENFFYAHLDSAVELTSKYAILVNQPLKDKDIQVALQDTRETLNDVSEQLERDLRNAISSDIETLKMEIDFVDVTMNKNKPLLEMKGETEHDRK